MNKMVYMVATLLLASCSSPEKQQTIENLPGKSEEKVAESLPPEKKAETDAVTAATAQVNPASFNGTLIIPPRSFVSVTLVMGGVVKEVTPLPGTYVRKGEIIGILENPDFIELQQNYLESRAQLEYLAAEYQRQQNLSREEVASQKKLQQSKAEYLSMQSRMQAAAAQLRLLDTDLDKLVDEGISPYIRIKAPVSGYISNIQANSGKYLEAGTSLCDMIDKNKIMVRLIAYEKDLKNVRIGGHIEFRVNGLGNTLFHAKLVSIGQQVDNTNRSIELYAEVTEHSPLFRPGMYVSAQLTKE